MKDNRSRLLALSPQLHRRRHESPDSLLKVLQSAADVMAVGGQRHAGITLRTSHANWDCNNVDFYRFLLDTLIEMLQNVQPLFRLLPNHCQEGRASWMSAERG